MLVEVRKSPISGYGVFATSLIREGTRWWSSSNGVYVIDVSRDFYSTFRETSKREVGFDDVFLSFARLLYYSASRNSLILIGGIPRFTNHSFEPNSRPNDFADSVGSIALRDIQPGEEIFENYFNFDICPWEPYKSDFLEIHGDLR